MPIAVARARCSMRDSAATRSASRVAASIPLAAAIRVVAGDRPRAMPQMPAQPVAVVDEHHPLVRRRPPRAPQGSPPAHRR